MPIVIDKVEYLISKEAALLAGRSVDTIGLWCRKGIVQSRQDGTRRWLVNRQSLEKFIKGESAPVATSRKNTPK